MANDKKHYWKVRAVDSDGQVGAWSGIVAVTSWELFYEEDYSSYDINTLPTDYIIKYNGAGNSEQYVAEENGNKYLRTSGKRNWSLVMRKEFDTDFSDRVEVCFRIRSANSESSYNYSYRNNLIGNFSHLSAFGIKNANEITIDVSISGLESDGKTYAIFTKNNEVIEKKKVRVDPNTWINVKLAIDFSNRTYSAYINGTLLFENAGMGIVNLGATWNSWGEKAGIRFESGNGQTTVSHFDDLVIKTR